MEMPQTQTNTWITYKTFHRSRAVPSFNATTPGADIISLMWFKDYTYIL